jgi:hypothetical protein
VYQGDTDGEPGVSYLHSWPKAIWKDRPHVVFQRIARLWFTDKFHADACRCPGCFLGPKGQLEL